MSTELKGRPVWSRERKIGHYGGALDKKNTTTEGVPYAGVAYRELQAMRPSAYSASGDDLVHVENVCLARSSSARLRAGEKVATNGLPSTSDEKLEHWVEVLRVPTHQPRTRSAHPVGSGSYSREPRSRCWCHQPP